MTLFGETTKERELRQEIENLRQQLDSARQAHEEENTLLIKQACDLQAQFQELQQEKAQLALKLRNYIHTAKRKAQRDRKQQTAATP